MPQQALSNNKKMDNLKITLVQADLIWEDATANKLKFDRFFENINTPTDLIILPEMFTTGFSMFPQPLAEVLPGTTSEWLKKWAEKLNAAIVGSLIIKEKNRYYNRLLWVMPDGKILHYDKRHLFSFANEHQQYTAGQEQLIVQYKGWKIMPLICYDLRFPVWSRNTMEYDLLIYIANFPDKRNYAWRNLLRARAIENQAYTIGLNRVGTDGNDVYYAGNSCVLNYDGHYKAQLSPGEIMQTVTLHHDEQKQFRKNFAFLDDQDAFDFIPYSIKSKN